MIDNNAQQSDVGAAFRRPSGVPIRKPNRLKDYDYSHYGAYFVTVCAKDNLDLFASIDTVAGAASYRPSLTATGKIIENEIKKLSHTYKDVIVEHHVIMPNHVHIIIFIDAAEKNGRQDAAPTISRTIGQWKRAVSIKAGRSVWQKSFYDRIKWGVAV